jgi:phosphate-selective porin OprO/OprP
VIRRVSLVVAIVALSSALAAAQEPSPAAPVVRAGPEGFSLRSGAGDFEIRLRGYLQVDGRWFVADEEGRGTDTIVVRRARPILEGTLYRIFAFRFMPDFGGGQTVLYDGYLEARISKAARLRAGKFKPPVGLERLQSATALAFLERTAPTLLVPSRDVGLQLGGELLESRLEYAVGLFNGVPDGGIGDTAGTDGKEVAARLFWRPFQRPERATAIDLGLGLAVTRGHQKGTPASPQLPSYRTPGGQTFFAYRNDGTATGTARADGERTRIAPQGWLYAGPFGALVEHVTSEQQVRRDPVAADLRQTAWQVQLSWVLTGERNAYQGVAPGRPFEVGEGGGAWRAAVRFSAIEVDPDAFPLLADPARSASCAEIVGLGVSWDLTRGARWMLEYDWTRFDGGDPAGDRPDEKTVQTRLQISF